VASKTVSDYSKLPASRAAFDLPVHEGGEVTTSHEPPHNREGRNKRTWSKPRADGATKPGAAAAAARKRPRAPEPRLSTLFGAASIIDGAAAPAFEEGLLPAREDAAPGPVGGPAKRLLDIVVAGTALVILSPLILAVALLIYVTMGRPILFPQRRLGFGGRKFACYKFRTMVRDAETTLRLHLDNNPDAAREWNARQKLQNDPRITAVGRILRRSSIDELPQLFSVLRGRMSCVGPRPIVDDEIPRYGDYWPDYMKARPGVTGIWQVSGRNRLSYEKRVALDRYYVRRWSIWLDMWILIKTIPAVLRSDETA
jgi:exopolysaccharide production protein ExoY